jgi:SNF2 family DNA or RNA helicase
VLVFYSFLSDIPRIQDALKGTGLEVRKYEDDRDLQDWNAGKIDVLLAHPASTAYGLNLQQGGHYIVWFGLTWNLELYLQANARLHRQGQEKPVQVYRLLCPGTVDERVARALESKEGVQEALLHALKEMLSVYVKA